MSVRDYQSKNRYMRGLTYRELSMGEFYKRVFPPETLERKGDLARCAANPIVSYKVKDGDKTYFHNEIVFADTFDETMKHCAKNDLALCSMISFSGRNKTAANAYRCHGFCIDLDGVGQKQLENFWWQVEELKILPRPTFLANSGNGVHVYYQFANPVPLYPAVAYQLRELKRGLTEWVWNRETSAYSPKERQFQGIYQSFRMPGSRTKLGSSRTKDRYLVRVWETGRPWSLDELNEYVDEKYRCSTSPDYASWEYADEEHHSLAECKVLYPEWYEKRIKQQLPAGQWFCNHGLYDWWLDKIQEGENARDGNRYHCISMLYIYAVKCGLPKAVVDEDAEALLEPYNALTKHEDNAFTIADIKAASKFYDPKFVKMSRKEIERRTGISIPTARRNHRSQSEHLARARLIRPIAGYANVGRPGKADVVALWRSQNPQGSKSDCCRETGLSRGTVYRWWDGKKG